MMNYLLLKNRINFSMDTFIICQRIATIPTDVFSKFPSSFKGEDMLRIGNQELGVLLQQILAHAYDKLGFDANKIKPYEYGSYDNFFDFSSNYTIFDEKTICYLCQVKIILKMNSKE